MRRATGTFGIRLVSLAMQFAGSIMIARLLGVAEFGVYAYAFTWVVLVGLMLSLGVTQLATRELPRFVALGQGAAFRFLNALEIVLISNNLGDAKSIATHPATTTHQRLPQAQKDALGITPGLIRLSIGLEDPSDLLADLTQALDAI